VQGQPSRSALAVNFERNLRVDDFQEKLAWALGKYLDFRLPGGLRKKMIAFTCNGQDEIRREFVMANISIEQFWIDGDLFVLLRWRPLAFHPFRVLVQAALMQNQFACSALTVG
jgi:hypothetical protein